MTILQIAALTVIAIVIGRLPRGRQSAMLVTGALAIFWLQPTEPYKTLGFWFPLATLGITVLAWALTSPPEVSNWKSNWQAASMLTAVVIIVAVSRYLGLTQILNSNIPPLHTVAYALIGIATVIFVIVRWNKAQRAWQFLALVGIIGVFIILKAPPLQEGVIKLRALISGSSSTPGSIPLAWLGYSYLAFRLMHTIRDRQSGRLPPVTLGEYVNYVIFFPSFTAGPIDRLERFIVELKAPLSMAEKDWIDAGSRLFVGLFKKFVIADLLAVISISDVLVSNVRNAFWLWVFLYAYALRIYFDFSGYTDVAIGMGRLMGIRLPENFNAPYLQTNLTRFWNSWHMTLTMWFRSYFFNPLTRSLRSAEHPLPTWLIILVTQITTMVLIGLWHGITLGFVAWGLWHGVGLFLQNRWSAFTQNRIPAWIQKGYRPQIIYGLGVFITFNYVALGWLFFTLSSPAIAWQAIQKLFGFA